MLIFTSTSCVCGVIRLNSYVGKALDRANIDTDAIISKQFLKSIRRAGFGPYLFDDWRYLDHGKLDMDCISG